MGVSKSSLSAGEIIRDILVNNAEVAARAKKSFQWWKIARNCHT